MSAQISKAHLDHFLDIDAGIVKGRASGGAPRVPMVETRKSLKINEVGIMANDRFESHPGAPDFRLISNDRLDCGIDRDPFHLCLHRLPSPKKQGADPCPIALNAVSGSSSSAS
jgi:hypothetical protein